MFDESTKQTDKYLRKKFFVGFISITVIQLNVVWKIVLNVYD